MSHKKRRNGKPYLHGESSPIHDEHYQATIVDIIRAINADPDLQTDDVTKSRLIREMCKIRGQELTDFLNTAYKKAYGVTANTKTPLAEWAEKIAERRNKEKNR